MVLVIIGGAVGTWLRYAVGTWFGEHSWAKSFPYGTMVINVSGSFILGIVVAVVRMRLPPESQYWYLLFGTGFCGGYTTFSTFEWETYQLVYEHKYLAAFSYVAGSVTAGFVAVALAIFLVDWLFPKATG